VSGLHDDITILFLVWVPSLCRLLLVSLGHQPLDPPSPVAVLVVVGFVLVVVALIVDCGGCVLVLVEMAEEVVTQPVAGFSFQFCFPVVFPSCFVCF